MNIPDALVKRVAQNLYLLDANAPSISSGWDEMPERWRNWYTRDARAILGVAYPAVAALAWDECVAWTQDEAREAWTGGGALAANPYREEA